jgi:hypothetical protein
MKAHYVNQLNNFICGWYIDQQVCDEIIEYHKNSDKKLEGVVRKGFGNLVVDKSLKDSTDVILNDDLLQKYNVELQKCVDEYIKVYPYCDDGYPWVAKHSTNIQYYKPNGGYPQWHTERKGCDEPQSSRHLVFMTYLNDVTDGGETEFYHQQIKIKPEKGLTLIWGSDWTFTHRGIVSPSQEKYIVTGWFNYVKDAGLV